MTIRDAVHAFGRGTMTGAARAPRTAPAKRGIEGYFCNLLKKFAFQPINQAATE